MNTNPTDVHGGKYYGRRIDDGSLEEVQPGIPDVVICRRVIDYPHQHAPIGSGFADCRQCSARIAYNPLGPHQDRPKICMQCARIRPLPINPGN